jgi:hypothetical protein
VTATMYTRLTARGCQDRLVWCARTAIAILAGVGRPLYPGGQRCPHGHRCVCDRRLPHPSGIVPVRPPPPTDPDGSSHETSARVSDQSPRTQPSPRLWPPAEQEPLSLTVSFAPGRRRPRTSRQGQDSDTDPGHAVDIRRPPIDAPTYQCDLVSQHRYRALLRRGKLLPALCRAPG